MPAKFFYALYSAKQARAQKCVYTGLTIQGKPFCASEILENDRKSYWADGVFVGIVDKWHRASTSTQEKNTRNS